MYAKRLHLRNFRCYEDFTIDFSPRVTVIVAENGKGKTAILDALAIAMTPYLSTFHDSRPRNFQAGDVRMILEQGGGPNGLGIPRMKYQLPVSLEVTLQTDSGKEFTWQREMKTLKGRTSSKHAKDVIAYGKAVAARLNGIGDEAVVLPVLGYYGTVRMWNDSSLLKGGDIDLSRTSGYIECLEPSGSYNTFGQWFRYASESALEFDHLIKEKGLKKPNPYRQILSAVKKAIIACIRSMGWTDIQYSFSAQNLLVSHPTKGLFPMEAMSDGARSVISMAADIAYRMARLNPDLGDEVTTKTPGVVLIDEVDMHLHPSWQQTVVQDLTTAFPKVQFILTTHSPQVLTSIRAEDIRILHWEPDDQVRIEAPAFSYGAESSQVLKDIQHVDSRPANLPIVKDLKRYLQLVSEDKWDSPEALTLRKRLDAWSQGQDPALVKADMDIRVRDFRRRKP
jgi:predicted ATP-binding protein involved in virulence